MSKPLATSIVVGLAGLLVLGSKLLLPRPLSALIGHYLPQASAKPANIRIDITDLETMEAMPPAVTEAYGPDPLEFGELRLPKGRGPFPVAVVIHGGCWVKGFATKTYMAPFASDLAAKGVATWNIEYRQIGDWGGGWPGSYLDWAAAADHLVELARRYPLDLTRVVATGHSAGATAALWLAARDRAAKSEVRGENPLKIASVVAIDGPGDLRSFIGRDAAMCGRPVIRELMGGTPEEVPRHFAAGDPVEMLPTGVPATVVATVFLPPEEAEAYRKAAVAKGDRVHTVLLRGIGHFDMLTAATPSGAQVERLVAEAANTAKGNSSAATGRFRVGSK